MAKGRTTTYLREQYQRATTMLPAGHERGLRGKLTAAVGVGVMALFDVNKRVIERRHPDLPDVWDPAQFPWVAEVEKATPQIRAEIERYLDEVMMPHVAEVSGLDPESEEGRWSTPGLQGHWRTTILFLMGRWLEPSKHFPATLEAVSKVSGITITNVGFTGLEGRSHIDEHVGPNKGGMRFQLPIIVPGQKGDCRIRVTDTMIEWEEGKAVMFDLAVPHEVWNDTDELRILLMMEMVMPLPFPTSLLNRFAQWSYRYFPSFRGMHGRVDQLGRKARPAAAA